MTGGPHIAWPVALAPNGQLLTVEEDTVDEVAQNVYWLASTEPGTVPDLPDAGVPSPAFVRGINAEQIAETLREQEQRAVIVDAREDNGNIDLDVAVDR